MIEIRAASVFIVIAPGDDWGVVDLEGQQFFFSSLKQPDQLDPIFSSSHQPTSLDRTSLLLLVKKKEDC